MALRNISWVYGALALLILLFVGTTVSFSQMSEKYSPDMLAIQGRWIRTDAPYIIELRHGPDSMLQATYFNRRFIHVEKTETATQNGLLYVMVTLQDVNYPGSTYLLSYDRKQDALHGTYFHAGSGQRYDVSFVRKITP